MLHQVRDRAEVPDPQLRALSQNARAARGVQAKGGGGGCGPEGGPKFPNGYKKASFLGACQAHDKCYDTCRSDRSECDEKFAKRVRRACASAYPVRGPKRHACMRRAELYSNAVIALGSVAYAEAQSKACQCCP